MTATDCSRPSLRTPRNRPPLDGAAPTGAGIRGLTAKRPLTVFLLLVFGIGWPVLTVPVLAFHGLIPGGELPIELFALAVTLLVMLPAALWVTSVTEGRTGVRALMSRAFRWRFGPVWWAVVLLALPVVALLLGLLFGGSLHTAHAGKVLAGQTLQILIAVLVINLWEETVWAGFLQTRLESRHNFVTAAALTAVPFAGVHMPLLLIGDHITVVSVLTGIAGLLLLGLVVRLMIGVVLHGAADSVLAVGILHQMFDASNNRGGLVDSFLDSADESVMTLVAAALIAAGGAAAIHRQLRSTPQRSDDDGTPNTGTNLV
jgi:uncharacterized protein